MRYRSAVGFTLLELLVSITILALIAALLLPVYAKVREAGRRTVCASEMRQLGMAIALYTDGVGRPPIDTDELVSLGKLDRRLLLCPSDPFGGYAWQVARCNGDHNRIPAFPVSYESTLPWPDYLARMLEAADPNHGILACRLHGNHTVDYTSNPSRFCSAAWLMYRGPMLRLRKDGSVQLATLRFFKPAAEGGLIGFSMWTLFTDEPVNAGP
jgi:prepilin-type N-terminal cleavage/methylation domain-containing protein